MPKTISITVIIPTYNSEDWIEKTVDYINRAVAASTIEVQLIIVDDGSTDQTISRAKQITPGSNRLKIEVVAMPHQGRYLTRKAGVERAKTNAILFVDSRVFITEKSLAYLESKLRSDMDQVWNGHVHVAKKGNIFARFWDAIVLIAWRRYFRHPQETTYGLKDFDYYPKGTGFFFVNKQLLLDAMQEFERTSSDLEFSSDDTLLIRYIAAHRPIHLSPDFSCLYHGRSTLKSFLMHAYHRGQFFVDGFLHRGNRFFIPLLFFLATSLLLLISLFAMPVKTLLFVASGMVTGLLGLTVGALLLGVSYKDALSLGVLSPFFAVIYGIGIWRGVLRKLKKTKKSPQL